MASSRLVKSGFRNGVNILIEQKPDFSLCTLHGHDFYELDIILGGCAPTTLNGREAMAQAGTVFFLSPADFHDYPTAAPLDICNIQFAEDMVSAELLMRLTDSQSRLYRPDEASFAEINRLTAIMQGLSAANVVNVEILTRLLECILLLLCQSLKEERHIGADCGNLQRAVTYLHGHFRENPSLGEVAALLHLNERYFCTAFHEYTGQTYKEYLKRMKLRYARRLLLATSLSVTEIAEQSGYGTQSHFNREFKTYYGVAPLMLRKTPG